MIRLVLSIFFAAGSTAAFAQARPSNAVPGAPNVAPIPGTPANPGSSQPIPGAPPQPQPVAPGPGLQPAPNAAPNPAPPSQNSPRQGTATQPSGPTQPLRQNRTVDQTSLRRQGDMTQQRRQGNTRTQSVTEPAATPDQTQTGTPSQPVY